MAACTPRYSLRALARLLSYPDPVLIGQLPALRQDQVAPVVAYLASEACTQTQTVFSAFMGRVAAVQVGITRGWTAADGSLSADDVAEHLPEILDTAGLLVPRTLYDEMGYVTAPEALPPE